MKMRYKRVLATMLLLCMLFTSNSMVLTAFAEGLSPDVSTQQAPDDQNPPADAPDAVEEPEDDSGVVPGSPLGDDPVPAQKDDLQGNFLGEMGQNTVDNVENFSIILFSVDIPTGLTGETSFGGIIMLEWNPVSGADGYIVYRADSENGNYEEIMDAGDESAYDFDTVPGRTYYYAVAAYVGDEVGPMSAPIAVSSTIEYELDLTVWNNSRIFLSWSMVEDATSYRVYRSFSENGTYTRILTLDDISCVDSDLQPNTTYHYKVEAYDGGTLLATMGPKNATTDPFTGSQLQLTAEVKGSNAIELKWDEKSSAEYYQIYRADSQSGPYELIDVVDAFDPNPTTYTDTNVSPGQTYYYKVLAKCCEQNTIGSGGPTSCTVPRDTLPAPLGLTARAISTSEIFVYWNSVSGAEKYIVSRSLQENGTYEEIATVTNPNLLDAGLNHSTTYWYKVVAVRGTEVSPEAGPKDATTFTPNLTAPLNLTATAMSASSIRLNWNTVDGATGYNIYRSLTLSGTYTYVDSVSGGNVSTYLDTGLGSNQTYYYYVTATRASEESPRSNIASATVMQGITVMVDAWSSTDLLVQWNDVDGATSYAVYRSTYDGGYVYQGSTSIPMWDDNNLNIDTTYWYKVVANNGSEGIGSGKTLPEALNVTVSNATVNSLQVNWNGISGATSYSVYRSTSSGGTYSLIATTPNTSYTNTGLSADTTYHYRVVANNGPTGVGSGKTLNEALSVTVSNPTLTSLDVSWNSISGATSYSVYRSTSLNGTYSYLTSTAYTYYTSTGLSPNTVYYYRVVANNGPEGTGNGKTLVQTLNVSVTNPTVSSLYVSWNSITGATSYSVYRSTSYYGTYTLIGTTAYTYRTDTGLNPNTTYYYKVIANNGPEGIGYNTTINQTLNVSVSNPTISSLYVSWNSISGATSYSVYRSTSLNGTYSYLTSTAYTYYTNTGLNPDTTYYYKVIANNGPQGIGSGKTLTQTLTVSVSNATTSSLYVSWNAITGATSYTVYRSTSYSGTYSYLTTTANRYYTNTGLSSNTTYYYKVVANNGPQGIGSGKTLTPAQILTVSVSNATTSSLYVSWNAITGATSYTVYRSTSYSGTYSYLTTTANRYYTNTGLSSNTTYYYKVVANNGPQGIGSGKTLQGCLLTSGDYVLYKDGNDNAVEVWFRHNTAYRYYAIMRQQAGSSTWTTVSYAYGYQPTRPSRYLFKIRDTGLQHPVSGSNTYYFKIRCYDANGNYADTAPIKLETRWQNMAIFGSNNTGTPLYYGNNSGFYKGPWSS